MLVRQLVSTFVVVATAGLLKSQSSPFDCIFLDLPVSLGLHEDSESIEAQLLLSCQNQLDALKANIASASGRTISLPQTKSGFSLRTGLSARELDHDPIMTGHPVRPGS
eukprot:1155106-Pelagomonas_calceolata.AAC.3